MATSEIVASDRMKEYFGSVQGHIAKAHAIAVQARKKGLDPSEKVEIALAANMAERVVGLISVIAPQIVDSGVVERIKELEAQYGPLDWRVALKIAEEVAFQKFCKFSSKEEGIDIGVRTGFAYSTVGVVSSPLDGLVKIEIKKRLDGAGEYFCLHFAGPIRNAGGTNAAVCAILGDYVRKKMGYATYDATDDEAKRAVTELQDYHERVTNLQYVPSEAEVLFLVKHLPIEIGGDPSETINVSNYKDLPRIPTNQIRSGYCLLLSSCIPLKAPKLWKQLSKWGADFDLGDWNFLEEFLKIQKASKAHGAVVKKESKITPDYTYITDLVAGRPVFGHPLERGGFRLRYGRVRCSGYSAQAVHPATMLVLDRFLAIGTQLKSERPGKGAVFTTCDEIEGPIVKLVSGDVLLLQSIQKAKEVEKDIVEILFLGDVLISYGDFFNRAHVLVPPGYCEEWWVKEVEKECVARFGSVDAFKLSEECGIPVENVQSLLANALKVQPSCEESFALSKSLSVPLHPRFTYHYADVPVSDLALLRAWLCSGNQSRGENGLKIVLPFKEQPKRVLEVLGVPHQCRLGSFVVIEGGDALALSECLRLGNDSFVTPTTEVSLDWVSAVSPVRLRDKSGIYIGSRMGRPEKAKMRKMKGGAHGLFPVGKEGGRLRSLTEAIRVGKISADAPQYSCSSCGAVTVYGSCHLCGSSAVRSFWCEPCAKWLKEKSCERHGECALFKKQTIPSKEYFDQAMKLSKLLVPPDLVKGVRGTFNADHYLEHMTKSLLRAKYDINVNKDGTIRYDCSEFPLTHFRPKEVRTSVGKLVELGYSLDVDGVPLTRDDQLLEILPQDVILPACPESPNEPADKVLMSVASFVDDELEFMYGLPRWHNVKTSDDLVGHIIIALAPHTSAGLACRIIGFSKTQGFFSHPYVHAACRRDCDGDEIGFLLLMDGLLNFSRLFLPSSRGSTMDAPLVLTSLLNPSEVDDMAFDVDIAWEYPLEFYDACCAWKMPWDVKIPQIKGTLGTVAQYEGMGCSHDVEDINVGVLCSAYKTLPTMEDKLKGQMALAVKIRAVNASDVARLVIEKHFIRDTKGNLRKFSSQEFRCVDCNEKFRRPPLSGKCNECGGKLLFTISEGSIIKYFEPMLSLAKKYKVPAYLLQSIELLQVRIEGVFGRDKEKQAGLGAWFG